MKISKRVMRLYEILDNKISYWRTWTPRGIKRRFFERKWFQWFLRLFGLIDRYQWGDFVYLTPEDLEAGIYIVVEATKAKMLTDARRFLPERAWSRIKIIYHPLGGCGTGLIEHRASVAWKYTPKRRQ